MERITTILIFIGLSLGVITAQESANQQINEIKRQPDIYLFAESTSEHWSDAQDNARFLLCMEVESWVKSMGRQDSSSGYVAKAKNMIFELKSMRGERYRAFMYLKKADLMPYTADENVMVIPTAQDHSVMPYVPEPALVTQPTAQQTHTPEASVILTPLETQMLTVTTGNNIAPFVQRLKSEGQILNYGRYRDMPDIACDLFVYNQEQQIVAYLRKTQSGYINLRSQQKDDIMNYKGCGAIWLQPK